MICSLKPEEEHEEEQDADFRGPLKHPQICAPGVALICLTTVPIIGAPKQ